MDKSDDVLKVAKADYPSAANVAVFPYAEMQYSKITSQNGDISLDALKN